MRRVHGLLDGGRDGDEDMKKIPTLFQRNYDTDHLVRDEITPGCEWVIAGEGIATRKWDGTAMLIKEGRLYKRYDAKTGRTPPASFEPAQPDPDPVTGHWPGWVPVEPTGKADQPARDAFKSQSNVFDPFLFVPSDGTYELCGPKVGGDPETIDEHRLIKHGYLTYDDAPRTFDLLKTWFATASIEGLVWHHPDGRMAKIKRRDFGLPWPPKVVNSTRT